MDDPATTSITIGQPVYNADGDKIGTIRGFESDGFYVTTKNNVESLSVEHERSGHEFGEAELVWRCSNCGEMGEIENIPEVCPGCNGPREDLYYWTED
ncbi:MAG: rubredoxin-like domain-containing protein [Halobacteriaceae archaeon]